MARDRKMRLEEIKNRKIKLEHERPKADQLQMKKEMAEKIFGKAEEKQIVELEKKLKKIEAAKAREVEQEPDDSLASAYMEIIEQLKNLDDRKKESEQVFNMDDKMKLESYRNYEAETKRMEEELNIDNGLDKKDKDDGER